MILTIGHIKGGVGKTTITVQLAAYLKVVMKKNILVIDADQQQSALDSFTFRNENQELEPIACTPLADGRKIITQIKTQKDLYSDILIDVGASVSNALKSSLMVSNALLIPVTPRAYDLNAISKLMDVVHEAQDLGANIKVFAFLSCADSQGSSNEEAIEFIKEYEEISFIDAPVRRRKSIATASGYGLSVFEQSGGDKKACSEIETLAKALFTKKEKK